MDFLFFCFVIFQKRIVDLVFGVVQQAGCSLGRVRRGLPGLGQASETVSEKCMKQYMEKCVKRAHEKVRGKGASKAAWIFA